MASVAASYYFVKPRLSQSRLGGSGEQRFDGVVTGSCAVLNSDSEFGRPADSNMRFRATCDNGLSVHVEVGRACLHARSAFSVQVHANVHRHIGVLPLQSALHTKMPKSNGRVLCVVRDLGDELVPSRHEVLLFLPWQGCGNDVSLRCWCLSFRGSWRARCVL